MFNADTYENYLKKTFKLISFVVVNAEKDRNQ